MIGMDIKERLVCYGLFFKNLPLSDDIVRVGRNIL